MVASDLVGPEVAAVFVDGCEQWGLALCIELPGDVRKANLIARRCSGLVLRLASSAIASASL